MEDEEKPLKTGSYQFDRFEVSLATRELLAGGEVQDIQRRVLDLLIFLIENRERVVSKDDIQDAVWPGTVVSETALTRAVMKARKALGDDASEQRFIKTLHGQGYRFVSPVREAEGAVAAPGRRDNTARRRDTLRVATTYGAVAWLVNQAAAMAWEVFEWDKLPVQILLGVSVLGFPVAVGLAWFFHGTADGLKLRSEVDAPLRDTRRRDRIVMVVLALALVLSVVWNFRPAPQAGVAAGAVAVIPIHNATGDSSVDWISLGLTSLVNNHLEDKGLSVVSIAALRDGFAEEESLPLAEAIDDRLGWLAGAHGARFAVRSELDRAGSQYRLRSVLYRGTPWKAETLPLFLGDEPSHAARHLAAYLGRFLDEAEVPTTFVPLASGDPFADQAFARGMHEKLTGNIARAKELLEVSALSAADAFWPNYELAQSMYQLGDLDAALDRYLDLLVDALELENPAQIGVLCNGIGVIYDYRGELDEAERYYRLGIEWLERAGLHKRLATLYTNLGILERARVNPDAAEDAFELARGAFAAAGVEQLPGSFLVSLGNGAADGGNIEQARRYYADGLSAFRAARHPRGEGIALSNLSWASQQLGDYEAAEAYLQASFELRQRIGDQVGALRSRVRQADLAYERGRFDHADRLAVEIIDAPYASDEQEILATAKCIRGYVALDRADFPLARGFFEEALEIDRQGNRTYGELRAQVALSEVHVAAGDYQRAATVAASVQEHEKAAELPEFRFGAEVVAARVLLARGNAEQAKTALVQILDDTRDLDVARQRSKAAAVLAELLIEQQQLADAERVLAAAPELPGEANLARARLALARDDDETADRLINALLARTGDRFALAAKKLRADQQR